MNRLATAVLLVAFVAFGPTRPVVAATFAAMDMDTLTDASARIVRGVVVDTRARFAGADNSRIVTDVTVDVAEDLLDRANAPGSRRVVFTTLGGIVGDRGQRVPGLPEYRVGDDVLLFLGPAIRTGLPTATPPLEIIEHRAVIGLALGSFFVQRHDDGGPARLARHLDRDQSVTPAPAFAWYDLAGVPGEYIRWYQDEIPVLLDSALTPDADDDAVRAAVAESITTWNAVDCPHPVLANPVEVTDEPPLREIDGHEHGTNLIVFQDDDEWALRHPTSAFGILDMSRVLALTTLYYNPHTGMAGSFSLEVNNGAHKFSTTGFMATNDIQNMLTHELGHVLGLDHPCRDRELCGETTMYYSAPAGETRKRTLHPDDIAGLCGLYGDAWAPEPPPGPIALAGNGGCAAVHAGPSADGASAPMLLLAMASFAAVLGRRSFVSRR